ncbi:Putative periplasmic DegP-like serine protease DegP-like precursor [Candidatus Fokinia solitaria]|uniref:Periplasmic DegP-like serine protease DegP-like n=1 Tax=Candidatus Fokinia solitaria TaxID=1802984 RepID=A0A2U8BSE8_9RICK|nr:trypsin-like peptidase domain-containing protein [Candidatus Fokinia solitaria]AWD33286.1 Putative periplasmic DegP-like serine protease DegP-like precursor [Candidatus Fokinia solitaria]
MYYVKFIASFIVSFVLFTSCVKAYGNEGGTTVQSQHDLSYVAEKILPATVEVRAYYTGKEPVMEADELFREFEKYMKEGMPSRKKVLGFGSGFIISADGYIVTCAHVIKDASKVSILLRSNDRVRRVDAKVIGYDEMSDIAVVKIKESNLPYLKFANFSKVKVGQTVVAFSSPMALSWSFTSGVISDIGRDGYIQTDMSANRGSSGGAMCNVYGDVIGMLAFITTFPNSPAFSGISFGIQGDSVEKIALQLIKTGKVERGYWGVWLQALDEDVAKSLQLRDEMSGVLVTDVAPGSIAQRDGIKAGDVILEVNGQVVSNTAQLAKIIRESEVGIKLPVKIIRNGDSMMLNVGVEKKLDTEEDVREETYGKSAKKKSIKLEIGAYVKPITQELKDLYHIPSTITYGLVIVDIVEDSILGDTQKPVVGYVIVEVDGSKITSVSDFEKAIANAKKKGQKYVKIVIAKEGRLYIGLKIN